MTYHAERYRDATAQCAGGVIRHRWYAIDGPTQILAHAQAGVIDGGLFLRRRFGTGSAAAGLRPRAGIMGGEGMDRVAA